MDSFGWTLDSLYHEHSIYRTIIICRYQDIKSIEQNLSTLNLSYKVCHGIHSLELFHRSDQRILILPFYYVYFYRAIITEWMVRDKYLFFLHELNSLQEQCCLDLLNRSSQNYYVYIH